MSSIMDGLTRSNAPEVDIIRNFAAVPFTPATGPRLLNHIAYENEAVRLALAGGLRELADQSGVSSAHVTFALPDEIAALERAGFLHRTDQQFHFKTMALKAMMTFE